MTNDTNPFCPDCGYRTYPLWEKTGCPHPCKPAHGLEPDDDKKAMHYAGSMIVSAMDGYRLHPALQIRALTYALSYVLARNTHPLVLPGERTDLGLQIDVLVEQEVKHNPDTSVKRLKGDAVVMKRKKKAAPAPAKKPAIKKRK